MTEAQISKMFKTWQHRLGLDHWHIEVSFTDMPGEDGELALMECHRSECYDRANIKVQPFVVTGDWPAICDEPRGDDYELYVEIKVVHELLHCHMRDVRFADVDIEGMLAPAANDVYQGVQKRCEEQVVDRLAHALVKAWNDGQ